jgi:hypothetical protein
MRYNTTLTWSRIRGYRFEAIAVLVIIALLATSEAGGGFHIVGDLFGR